MFYLIKYFLSIFHMLGLQTITFGYAVEMQTLNHLQAYY